MNRSQLQAAFSLAVSPQSLPADLAVFNGFALRDFPPVVVTLQQVAALIRWQCIQLGGQVDNDALAELADAGRRKFTVLQ